MTIADEARRLMRQSMLPPAKTVTFSKRVADQVVGEDRINWNGVMHTAHNRRMNDDGTITVTLVPIIEEDYDWDAGHSS